MIASIHLFTSDGEQLVTVEAHDFAPFVTLTLRGRPTDLTRDQARQVSDALRAAGLTADHDAADVPARAGEVE